jgi:hypothetical protein
MNEKVTFWKIAVIGIFVFVFGYFAGNILKFKNTLILEGYEYDALVDVDATSSDATSCNATTSNATTSNATTSNTTSSTTTTNTSTNNNVTNNTNTPVQTVNNENVSFENSKITADQIKGINDSIKPLNVTLNCDGNSVVSSSIFDAIKKSNSKLILTYGKDTMTFLGSNITEPKDINFSVSLSDISTNDKLKEFASSGVVLVFPDNNNLPGSALVSINIDSVYSSNFTDGILAVYYYNETANNLELVANNLKITNNTIEFTINHNSSYILTSSTIDQEKNAEQVNNEVVRFVNNKMIYIVVIGVSILLIIIVTVVVFVHRKKKFGKMI